ncbi:MAG: hypothetical protein K6E96_03705 [Bacteroidales bacterium]|nr:hypothetical protein [Bacteroidales bacterium]
MNTDELIEQIHNANAVRREREHHKSRHVVWRIAVPTVAAAAAILLIVILPHNNEVQAATPAPGIYCNSQCNPDDVLALLDNNINHIRSIQSL